MEQSIKEAALPLGEQPFTVRYIQDGQEIIQHTTLDDSIDEFNRDFGQEKGKLESLWGDWADTQAKIDKLCADLLNHDADNDPVDEVSTAIQDLEKEIEDVTKTSLKELDGQVNNEKELEKKFQKIWDSLLREFEDFDD